MKHSTRKLVVIVTIAIVIIFGVTSCIIMAQNQLIGPKTEENSAPNTPGNEPPYNFDYSWVKNNPYIAHALGGILGDTFTNSREAFLLNYQLGHRLFEVDFCITDDGYTVATHDINRWHDNATIPPDSEIGAYPLDSEKFTYDNFMSSLSYGKYHTMDIKDLFELLETYPDAYLVTDTKYLDKPNVDKQFSAFVSSANEFNPELLDRFIIQIYKPEMLDWIMDIYPWKSVIYTLYQDSDWTPENVLAFSKTSGVKFITMWDTWLTPTISDLWKSADIKIATHTINNLTRAKDSRNRGADVIYTDFLLP